VLTDHALRQLQAYDWPGNVRELENLVEKIVNFDDSETFLHSFAARHAHNRLTPPRLGPSRSR
jgi:transcriptional regulator with PAS, ATPase and Fis domain